MALFKNVRETTVNGKKVHIYLLPATRGLVMAKKLSQLVLPTISGFAEASNPESGISLATVSTLLVESLDDLDIEDIVIQLLSNLVVEGQEVTFDDYFMANYGELVEILQFALEQNFSSFFTGKGLGSLLSKIPQIQQTQVELDVE